MSHKGRFCLTDFLWKMSHAEPSLLTHFYGFDAYFDKDTVILPSLTVFFSKRAASPLFIRVCGFSDFYVKFVTPALNAETSPTASFFIYSPFVLRMMPAMDLGGVIS